VEWPPAEVSVTPEVVVGLLEDQAPQYAHLEVALLGEGFDNWIFAIGPELCARLPRRAVAVALLANEQRWLPEVAARVELALPVPVLLGEATSTYPFPWHLCRQVAGTPADQLGPLSSEAATALGHFLRALHLPATAEMPVNPWRSVDLATRAEGFRQRVEVLGDALDASVPRIFEWASGLAGPPQRRFLHGDCHPGNLVTAGGVLTGVLDFGDCCAGDPAVDLGAALLAVDHAGASALLGAYGADDPLLRGRAAGWAALFSVLHLGSGAGLGPYSAATAQLGVDNARALAAEHLG